jgi:peptidyl-prolyl cis-trans isomerase D
MAARGGVQGPRLFGGHWAVWRVDAIDTAFVPPYEAIRLRSDAAFNRERARKDSIEARAYYEQHRAEFKAPVKYELESVTLTVAPPESVVISEAELRRRYEANRSAWQQEEQVKARHLLFSTRGATPEVDRKMKERADSLLAAIREKSDVDFEALVRSFSQEPGAAASGGDLGWFGRKRMVKEFEDAAFALKPGEISGVVKTMFGYHIIKVEGHKAAGIRPFVEVQSELRTQMAEARADTSAMRRANALRRRLALGERKAAASYGGIVMLSPIAANEPLPGFGVAPGLSQELPTMAVGRWASKPYKVGNKYAVVRLVRRIPEHPADFDEARPRVTSAVLNDKRRAALAEKAKAIRAALAAGASFDSVAAPWGGLKDSGFLLRASSFLPYIGAEPRVVEKAYASKVGEVSDTLHTAQGLVWLRVQDRKQADASGFAAASSAIEGELLKKRYDAWVEEKKKTVKIEVLRPDLRGPRTVAALNP